MKKDYLKKGFTLVELIVVISIIALFSSVVLAGVTGLRARAQEATIKAELKNIESQAAITFNNTGDYSTTFDAVSPMIERIKEVGGTSTFFTLGKEQPGVSNSYDHYSVSARLNSDPTRIWSVSDQSVNLSWGTADEPGLYFWTDANAACANAGGRLPTIEELKSLCEMSNGLSAVPGFDVESYPYWSSTKYNSTTHFYLYPGSLCNTAYNEPVDSDILLTRCVR